MNPTHKNKTTTMMNTRMPLKHRKPRTYRKRKRATLTILTTLITVITGTIIYHKTQPETPYTTPEKLITTYINDLTAANYTHLQTLTLTPQNPGKYTTPQTLTLQAQIPIQNITITLTPTNKTHTTITLTATANKQPFTTTLTAYKHKKSWYLDTTTTQTPLPNQYFPGLTLFNQPVDPTENIITTYPGALIWASNQPEWNIYTNPKYQTTTLNPPRTAFFPKLTPQGNKTTTKAIKEWITHCSPKPQISATLIINSCPTSIRKPHYYDFLTQPLANPTLHKLKYLPIYNTNGQFKFRAELTTTNTQTKTSEKHWIFGTITPAENPTTIESTPTWYPPARKNKRT